MGLTSLSWVILVGQVRFYRTVPLVLLGTLVGIVVVTVVLLSLSLLLLLFFFVTLATRSWTCLQPPPKEKYFNVEPLQRTGVPDCRIGHTVCSYRGRVYMYGGMNAVGESFRDVICYDIGEDMGVICGWG